MRKMTPPRFLTGVACAAVIFLTIFFINACTKENKGTSDSESLELSSKAKKKPSIAKVIDGVCPYECGDERCINYTQPNPNCGGTTPPPSENQIITEIKQTIDYQEYVANFQNLLGALDFSKATYTHLDSGSYVTIPTFNKVGTSSVPKAQFGFSYNDSTLGIGIVYNYTGATVSGTTFLSGNYKISFPNGWELCVVEKYQNGTVQIRDGKDISLIDAYIAGSNTARAAVGRPCYYGYVRHCYTSSKSACERDPDCNFYCDFLPCGPLRLLDCSLQGLKYCKLFPVQ